MANGVYENGIKNFALGNIAWITDASPTSGEKDLMKCTLVDTADYTVNLATHENRDTGTIATAAQEEVGQLTIQNATTGGTCDANDITFVGTTGDTCEAILVYFDSGAAATDKLLFWWDTAAGLPVTLGGDVTVQWNASGLATI